MRKIIQIAMLRERADVVTLDSIVALCSDGSLWIRTGEPLEWQRIEPIPQDDKNPIHPSKLGMPSVKP